MLVRHLIQVGIFLRQAGYSGLSLSSPSSPPFPLGSRAIVFRWLQGPSHFEPGLTPSLPWPHSKHFSTPLLMLVLLPAILSLILCWGLLFPFQSSAQMAHPPFPCLHYRVSWHHACPLFIIFFNVYIYRILTLLYNIYHPRCWEHHMQTVSCHRCPEEICRRQTYNQIMATPCDGDFRGS